MKDTEYTYDCDCGGILEYVGLWEGGNMSEPYWKCTNCDTYTFDPRETLDKKPREVE